MDINQLGLPDESLLDHIDYRTHRRKINTIIIISIIICIILLILSTIFIYLFIKKEEFSSSIQHSTVSGQINIGNLGFHLLYLSLKDKYFNFY
jgi:hypothetical protein